MEPKQQMAKLSGTEFGNYESLDASIDLRLSCSFWYSNDEFKKWLWWPF